MPTNPTTPNTNASVDRLTLGVDSPRGSEPSMPCGGCCVCTCFDAEASVFQMCACGCFEANEAAPSFTGAPCVCFEAEASFFSATVICSCFDVE